MILETMTVQEAAERLGITSEALYQAMRSESDAIKAVRCGGRFLLLRESVETYRARPYRAARRKQEGDGEQTEV